MVVNSPADGTTILFTTAALVLIVHPSVAAKSAEELVELAKKKPGGLSAALTVSGSTSHLAAEMFKQLAGINFTVIPYHHERDAVGLRRGQLVRHVRPRGDPRESVAAINTAMKKALETKAVRGGHPQGQHRGTVANLRPPAFYRLAAPAAASSPRISRSFDLSFAAFSLPMRIRIFCPAERVSRSGSAN